MLEPAEQLAQESYEHGVFDTQCLIQSIYEHSQEYTAEEVGKHLFEIVLQLVDMGPAGALSLEDAKYLEGFVVRLGALIHVLVERDIKCGKVSDNVISIDQARCNKGKRT